MVERGWIFVRRAGTVILGLSIILWAAMTYPKTPDADKSTQLANSLAGQAGHTLEPVIKPLGFDWKIGVGLIGAFAAVRLPSPAVAGPARRWRPSGSTWPSCASGCWTARPCGTGPCRRSRWCWPPRPIGARLAELAAVIGASLQGLGFEANEAAEKVVDLEGRAADMAATFGGTTEEAVAGEAGGCAATVGRG